MAWSGLTKKVTPFEYNYQRDPCDCSQHFTLAITGLSEKQGPTHYCPGCRWAFWVVEVKPTADQISLAKKDDPQITEANMKYTKLANKPIPKWGSSSETMMIDQLGKLGSSFLTKALQNYWADKYCDKYPNSDFAKARNKYKKEQQRKLEG